MGIEKESPGRLSREETGRRGLAVAASSIHFLHVEASPLHGRARNQFLHLERACIVSAGGPFLGPGRWSIALEFPECLGAAQPLMRGQLGRIL